MKRRQTKLEATVALLWTCALVSNMYNFSLHPEQVWTIPSIFPEISTRFHFLLCNIVHTLKLCWTYKGYICVWLAPCSMSHHTTVLSRFFYSNYISKLEIISSTYRLWFTPNNSSLLTERPSEINGIYKYTVFIVSSRAHVVLCRGNQILDSNKLRFKSSTTCLASFGLWKSFYITATLWL